jgi:hypothetical protein
MILNFKTKFRNGKETYFEQKIWNGILLSGVLAVQRYNEYLMDSKTFMIPNKTVWDFTAKKHTIREDKTDRWQAGKIIDFFTGARTKKARRFAPRIKCTGTQKIEVIYNNKCSDFPVVKIDGVSFYAWKNGNILEQLAVNDGFSCFAEFCKWFDRDFKGKIIHWTYFRY